MSRFRSRLATVMVAAVVAVTAPNVKSVSNSSPVGVDDNFEVVEGTRLVVDAPGLLVNDFDPDGDPIASGFHSDPSSGAIVAMAQDGAFAYEPDPGFVGFDSFSYAVRDDLGTFTSRVVEAAITVTAAPISVDLVTATANGDVVATQVGSFVYTPDPGFTGVDSFRYAVADDHGRGAGLVGVVITVTPTPDPTTDRTTADGAIAGAEQSSGVGKPPVPTDPGVTTTIDSATSPAASTASSAAIPAALAVTGTTSNPLIPAALFGAGLLVIAFGVRRARNDADEPFEQA